MARTLLLLVLLGITAVSLTAVSGLASFGSGDSPAATAADEAPALESTLYAGDGVEAGMQIDALERRIELNRRLEELGAQPVPARGTVA